MKNVVATLVMLLLAGLAQAETSNVSPTGFTSTLREEVKATPEDVWKAVVQLPRWWSDAHTYSGKASNLTLEPVAGGCWCERWGEGNSVQHGQVVLVQPGRVIRLNASLGPLQELAVNGVLTIVASAQDGKTFLRMTYRVAGNADAGLEKLAPVVDQVIGVQYRRLKALVETGAPQ
ncbi:MAG: SRPBCC domain-containing protein [Burkholderiaceae bacterium]